MKMVHCPKCGFEQPDDQYCANCGVNMGSFKAPPLTFVKKFLKNWLGQFAVLIVIILALLIYDRVSNPVNPFSKRSHSQSYYKQTSTKDGEEAIGNNTDETPSASEEESSPQTETESTAASAPPPPPPKSRELSGGFKRVSVSFYEVTDQQLEEIVKQSKEHSSEGESVLGVIDKDIFEKLVKTKPFTEKDMKSLKMAATRTLFLGKKDKDYQQPFGIFYDFTRLNSEKESLLSLEIKSYYHLHLDSEDPAPLFRGEFTMSNSSLAYISGLTPKNLNLTKLDKKMIDSVGLLQKFFSPTVIDGNQELIMIVEPRR